MIKKSSDLSPDLYLYDDLFLFGTSALQKPADMAIISRSQREEYGLRFGIFPLDEWVTYHAAVEDGINGHDNNILKAKEAADAFDHLRPDHSMHEPLLTRLRKEKLIAYDPKNPDQAMKHIWLLTEDTTASMPLDIWRKAAETILPHVDPHLIYSDIQAKIIKGEDEAKTIQGVKYVVMPDIGPLLRSAKPYPFFEALRKAGAELGYSEIPYYIHCDCAATRLSDSKQDQFFKFQDTKELRVYLPDGINTPLVESKKEITTSDDYLCLPNNTSRPISADLGHYVINESPRRLVLDKIAKRLQTLHQREKDNVVTFPLAAAASTELPKKTKKADKGLKIISLSTISSEPGSSGWNLKKIGDETLKYKVAEPSAEGFIDALGMEFPFKSNNKIRHPDLVILPPFDNTDPVQRIHAAANFTKATTGKQIDPRMYPVPVVVMNLNGCYDQLMALHRGYINLGYCSDYERQPFYDVRSAADPIVTVKGVMHRATGMVDELVGNRESDLYRALMEVKPVRLEHYARRHIKPLSDGELKFEEYPEIFGVGYFSSATSQKRRSLETAGAYGEFLARQNMALYTGGGDKDLMYAPVKPYVRNHGPYLGVFSTFGLVTKETAKGHLPPAQMSRLTRSIGPRIGHLLGMPDQFVAWDGGRGTGQERAAFLAAQILRPDLVADKKFYSFDPHARDKTDNTIHRLQIDAELGEGAYDKLLKDHDAFSHLNFYLTTELKHLKSLTLENAARHEARRRQSGRSQNRLTQ